jgi:hypothetical protein
MSELSWWTVQDLERKAGLTRRHRERLEHSLRERATAHRSRVQRLHDEDQLDILPLQSILHSWSRTLLGISDFTEQQCATLVLLSLSKESYRRFALEEARQQTNKLPRSSFCLTT